MNLLDFVRESNRIEGILREPTEDEMMAHGAILHLDCITTKDLEGFVGVIAPGHRLRDKVGLNVRVGDHIAPAGGPQIREELDHLLRSVNLVDDPWSTHVAYETLHPFTDGNGRSGRALWLWQMQAAPIGFLHQFYYQTLSGVRAPGVTI